MITWIAKLSPDAHSHISDASKYYNSKSKGLGIKFYKEAKKTVNILTKSPYFQVRYDNIRCLPFKTFPYMIHFELDEKKYIIYIHAIICTLKDPDTQWLNAPK